MDKMKWWNHSAVVTFNLKFSQYSWLYFPHWTIKQIWGLHLLQRADLIKNTQINWWVRWDRMAPTANWQMTPSGRRGWCTVWMCCYPEEPPCNWSSGMTGGSWSSEGKLQGDSVMDTLSLLNASYTLAPLGRDTPLWNDTSLPLGLKAFPGKTAVKRNYTCDVWVSEVPRGHQTKQSCH